MQRIAIARAYYQNGLSLFIFDEPCSSLDPISEDIFTKTYLI